MGLWTIAVLAVVPARGETTFQGKKVPLKEAPRTQWTAHDAVHVLGDAIEIDGCKFPASGKGGGLKVATVPDGAPNFGVTAASTPTFAWTQDGAKREVQLRFAADEKGGWRYRAEFAWEYRIGGETLRLIDTDANGHYDAFGADGCTTYDTNFVLPLEKELVLGANRVAFASIAPDGSKVVATVTPIRAGTSELAALVRINQWRAAAGLPAVVYDPDLCANCTAHADYLRRHSWNGDTDPHFEEAGSAGATPGGERASKRSDICKGPVLEILDGFLDTYYHRLPLMAPALRHVGINDHPDDMTVLDVAEGMRAEWPTEAGWSCPVFSPAPGERGVPTAASGEAPREPVTRLDTRGLPLMVLFDFRDYDELQGFSGKLFVKKGGREVEVPALPADPWRYPYIRGIVPEMKLLPKSQYRAVFTWTHHGKPGSQVVDFTTR